MNNLEQLIDAYALNKNELDSYKKICDAENAEIKALMTELELDKASTENYTATLSIQHRETMDEDKMLEVVRNSGLSHLIRTKEYVDMDLLEDELYHNKIDADTMAAMNRCWSTKEVQVLKITKKKEK